MAAKSAVSVSPWSPFSARDLALVVLIPVALLLPLLNKAFHIDDPLFVWTAKQVLETPFDFYGYLTNWSKTETRMYEIMQNPPLLSYYLAPFGAALGWKEWVLHALMLPLTALGAAGTYMAARRFCSMPLLAAGIVVFSPGFLVSASQIMSDVPMVACWSWALYCWMRALDDDRPGWAVAAALLIGLGALTKYFAFSLVPMLLVFTWLERPDRRAQLWYLLIPVAMLLAFEAVTYRLYGVGLLNDAGRFAAQHRAAYGADTVRKIQVAVAFTGATMASTLFFIPWLWSRAATAGWAALIAAIFLFNLSAPSARVMATVYLVNINNPGSEIISSEAVSATTFQLLQWSLWTVGGLHMFVLLALALNQRRDPSALMVALWIGGTLFFITVINHFVNARVILPLALAAALLMVWRLERIRAGEEPAAALPLRFAWCAVALAGVLSVSLNYLDYRLAGSSRDAAAEVMSQHTGEGTVWFSGHSGWQYYMQELGAKPVDEKRVTAMPGDTYVLPSNNWQPIPINASLVKSHRHLTFPVPRWGTTSHYQVYAGFYSDGAGPLPYVFGPVPEEVYLVVDIGAIREL